MPMIWPWWLRCIHWVVAVLTLSIWVMTYVFYETGWWHRTLGYTVIVLVVIRLLAGITTTCSSARFYMPTLAQVLQHIRQLYWREVLTHTGHNPLGQWAVYFMWGALATLAFTGWLAGTDAFWGEDQPIMLHGLASSLLLGLVVLHVLAVVVMSHLTKQRLIRQMLHGKLDCKQ